MPLALTIIQALPTVVTGINHLLDYINEVRLASRQSGEWTDEIQAKFEAALIERARLSIYTPDAP